MWQATYEKLGGLGFVVVTVALDRSTDDARPWIDAARPTHPSLVDARHVVADLYNVVNVPTVVWIDEHGRIARPNDVAFGTDTYRALTGLEAAAHLARLESWIRGSATRLPDAQVRAWLAPPTDAGQLARAECALGRWLYERGRQDAAVRHFVRAGELAPHDFTIRRGTMPMRNLDPMGPAFREMVADWTGTGHPYYRPLPGSRPSVPGPLTQGL